jgi:lipopolysaccharide biosynthesis glycosyltransferase
MYSRPTKEIINDKGKRQLIDELSIRPDYNGGMSTEFAQSRFLTPFLAESGIALFMDCDMLFRDDVNKVFQLAEENPQYAVMCVKHDHRPTEKTKMDGQTQSIYDRKNWSSFCVWRVDHPSNRKLTLEMINTLPGRDLHGFCWLDDDEIGELDPKWNWLAGYSDPRIDPAVVHYTQGTPAMEGHEDAPYADEFWSELRRWAA